MATYYKYAERSAESQVNWAEIGKNMTDMLRQEVAVREEKKAAIDEATRKYAEQLSNAPQGAHRGAKEEALRFADEATKYMLMQEGLLKSGLLNPRDYMIARQNLVDGTKRAFGAMKAFQEQYAERMERARMDESSALELDDLEEVQGYGNFSQSGFFIDAPTGKVNVGMKEFQTIDGKQVIGLKEGSTRGMEYIDGSIYGKIDKFKPRESLVPIAETLGTEITSSLDPATLSKLGSITSIEDLRNRKDIDPKTNKELFNFYESLRSSVGAVMANPLQMASLLRDTLGYNTTLDANAAAKDPKLILKVIDPATGRGQYQFTEAQQTEAEDWMMGQLLGMVNRKITMEGTGYVPQPRARTEAEIGEANRRKEAENFGRNLGRGLKSPDLEERDNAIKYLAQAAGRQVKIKDGRIYVADLDGKGATDFALSTDPDKLASSLISAFGADLPEDIILKFAKEEYKGKPSNISGEVTAITTPAAEKKANPINKFTAAVTADFQDPNLVNVVVTAENDAEIRDELNRTIAVKYPGIKFDNAYTAQEVFIPAADGRPKSPYFPVGTEAERKKALVNIETWIKKNYLKGATLEEREAAAENWLGPDPDEGSLDN